MTANPSSQEYEPAWLPDGQRVAFVVDNTKIDVIDVTTGSRTTAVAVPAGQMLHNPAWTPEGRCLVYFLLASGRTSLVSSGQPLVTSEEVFPFRVSWSREGDMIYTRTAGSGAAV